jgi:hypothetical protein
MDFMVAGSASWRFLSLEAGIGRKREWWGERAGVWRFNKWDSHFWLSANHDLFYSAIKAEKTGPNGKNELLS